MHSLGLGMEQVVSINLPMSVGVNYQSLRTLVVARISHGAYMFIDLRSLGNYHSASIVGHPLPETVDVNAEWSVAIFFQRKCEWPDTSNFIELYRFFT